MSDEHKTITVPVVMKFGDKVPIGTLTLIASKLPPLPDYVFVLGYYQRHRDTYELVEVAVQQDSQYKAYLDAKEQNNG